MKSDWLENDKSQNSLNSGTDLIRIKTDVLFGTKLKYIYDKSTSPKAGFLLVDTTWDGTSVLRSNVRLLYL